MFLVILIRRVSEFIDMNSRSIMKYAGQLVRFHSYDWFIQKTLMYNMGAVLSR
jgi:hypothetical protein